MKNNKPDQKTNRRRGRRKGGLSMKEEAPLSNKNSKDIDLTALESEGGGSVAELHVA